MKNLLFLITLFLLSLFYSQNVFCADLLSDWKPVKRSLSMPAITINEEILLFHFEYPTENNFIQIYDQSGQLIFEDCFSTLSSPDYQISLEDFSVGCYTVYYSDSNGQMSGFLTIDE